jgi:Lon protease-like protein
VADGERSLPLFPLNTVLFPWMLLPLHIFEERYRQMIGGCLASDRTFGVVLIREGLEVGGPAKPFHVGTIAQIAKVDRLADGRMNLVALGMRRFRLVKLEEETPYLVGQVAELRPSAEAVDDALVRRVRERFLEFVRELRGGELDEEKVPLSNEPETLSFQIAATLGVTSRERQALLEAESTADRLQSLERFIRREQAALRRLGRNLPSERPGPISRN